MEWTSIKSASDYANTYTQTMQYIVIVRIVTYFRHHRNLLWDKYVINHNQCQKATPWSFTELVRLCLYWCRFWRAFWCRLSKGVLHLIIIHSWVKHNCTDFYLCIFVFIEMYYIFTYFYIYFHTIVSFIVMLLFIWGGFILLYIDKARQT